MNPEDNKNGPEQFYKEKLRVSRTVLLDASTAVPAYRPAYKRLDDVIAEIERLISTPL